MPNDLTALIEIDPDRVIADIPPLLFGGFAEHIGRCIYGGIYDPASPYADADGLRRDLHAALRELNFSVMRYPGGNFVSGYNWLDGVGPREHRPRRRELAWQSIESNQFGTDEFLRFCRKIHAQPMMGLNFGTGSAADAANLVEYCNAPTGTQYSDLRARHGSAEPYGVKYWCLGNEMDGPWQIGHLDAHDYGKKALEAAKMMKWIDPSVRLISCGSSNASMSTFPQWDRVTLETCWDYIDYHSMHLYAENRDNDTPSYLASAVLFENYVDTLSATVRYVKAKRRSKKDIHLSWDEWNVWYKAMNMNGNWAEAPRLVEEVYNLEDALVIAQFLSVFLRRCDVVKIACLAQIVNAIAPMTLDGGRLLKQTTYYPFMLYRKFAVGTSLDPLVQSPSYPTARHGDVNLIDASVTHDLENDRYAVFLINRSQTESVHCNIDWLKKSPVSVGAAWQLSGNNPKAANTFDAPDRIKPVQLNDVQIERGSISLRLPPLSLTVLQASQSP